MELDELKSAWNKASSEVKYSQAALKDIFEVRTKQAVGNMNRKMLWDALFMVAATAAFIALTFILGLRSRFMVSAELVFLAAILILHYRIKYLTINRFDFEATGIVTMLTKVVIRLKRYILLYRTAVPVLAAALYLLYRINVRYYQSGIYTTDAIEPADIGIAIAIAAATWALSYVITRIMYSKEVVRLENLVRALRQL